MNDNDFYAFEITSAGRRAAALLESYKLKLKDLFDAVHTQVMESVEHMVDGEKCTAEQLCGPEMWDSLGIGPQRAAGMCLAYLVAEELVPLFPHCKNSGSGKKRYCTQRSQRPEGMQSNRVAQVGSHGLPHQPL